MKIGEITKPWIFQHVLTVHGQKKSSFTTYGQIPLKDWIILLSFFSWIFGLCIFDYRIISCTISIYAVHIFRMSMPNSYGAEIVTGYEYHGREGYEYLGKDDDGQPEFLTFGDGGDNLGEDGEEDSDDNE